jgi:hypothetical protein
MSIMVGVGRGAQAGVLGEQRVGEQRQVRPVRLGAPHGQQRHGVGEPEQGFDVGGGELGEAE